MPSVSLLIVFLSFSVPVIVFLFCHFQVKYGMEIFFCVEVESRFLSECSRDGANGRAAL